MCDPIGMIGMALSVGMQAAQASAQQEMYNKQQAANEQWLAYQRRKARDENVRQEQMRLRAETARQGAEAQLSQPEQEKARQAEEQRLAGQYASPTLQRMENPQLLGDMMIAGGPDSLSVEMKGDLAGKLAGAAREARQRIANLAAVTSYGGSQFGLANRANDVLGTSLGDIRLAAEERRGSLTAYGAEKGVEPLRYERTSSGFGGAAQGLAGMAGKALGGAAAGGV